MTASELPPNIRDFNEITGVLFGRLYASFPNPKVIPAEAITQALQAGRSGEGDQRLSQAGVEVIIRQQRIS